MSNTSNLRPAAVVTGKVIALLSSKYDFQNDRGENVTGTSYKLWVAEVDENRGVVSGVYEFKVRQADASSLSGLSWDDDVQVHATGFVRVRGKDAVIEWTAREIVAVATGEMLLRAA